MACTAPGTPPIVLDPELWSTRAGSASSVLCKFCDQTGQTCPPLLSACLTEEFQSMCATVHLQVVAAATQSPITAPWGGELSVPIRPMRLTVLPPLVKAPGTCLRGWRELPGGGVGCHDVIMRTSLPETGPRWHAIGKRTV